MSEQSFQYYCILSQLICPPELIPNTPTHGLLGQINVEISGFTILVNDRALIHREVDYLLKWNGGPGGALCEQLYFLNEYAIAHRRGIVFPIAECPTLVQILEEKITYEDLIQFRDEGGFNSLAYEPGLWTVDHGGFTIAVLTGYGNVILLWFIPETRVLLSTLRLDTLKNFNDPVLGD